MIRRRCEADQRRLERHREEPKGGYPWGHGNCATCSCQGALAATDCHYTVEWPCPDILDIASTYSHLPGYQEAWRP